MPRSAQITLDGTEYQVPALNIDQLERLSDLMAGPANRVPFGVLRIALERALPAVIKAADLTPAFDEVQAAVSQIMVMSGLRKPGAADQPTVETSNPSGPAAEEAVAKTLPPAGTALN